MCTPTIWIKPQEPKFAELIAVYTAICEGLYDPSATMFPWWKRGDMDVFQWMGSGEPGPVSEHYAALEAAKRAEVEVVEKAKKICASHGVELLPSGARLGKNPHFVPEANWQPQELEPGYAWLKKHKGGWTLRISKWGPPIKGVLKESKVRTDNGPALSHGSTEFIEDGYTEPVLLKAWTSGAGAGSQWPYKITEGESPSSAIPGNAYGGPGPHPCGRGHSSASDEKPATICRRQYTDVSVEKFPRWRVVDLGTGAHVSNESFETKAQAEADMSTVTNWNTDVADRPIGVDTRYPWEIAPEMWMPVFAADTAEKMGKAILAFGVFFPFRAYRSMPGRIFNIEPGIVYENIGDIPPVDHAVVECPEINRDIFIWCPHKDLILEATTKSGRRFKMRKRI